MTVFENLSATSHSAYLLLQQYVLPYHFYGFFKQTNLCKNVALSTLLNTEHEKWVIKVEI